MNFDINNLKESLTKSVLTVEFEKLDGTLRTMRCTLDPSVVPQTEGTSNRKPNDNVQVVWDVEAQGWRSFRIDRIKNVEQGL